MFANWFNIPNFLTLLRLAMVGFMPLLFIKQLYLGALVLFLAAGLTDLLDGYIARKYNQVTDFGKLMDPLADKLMLVTTLLLFAIKGWTPLVIFILVAIKEVLMVSGSVILLKKKDYVVFSNVFGKLSTIIFTLAVFLTFLHVWVTPWDQVAMWVAIASSVIAIAQYGIQFVCNMKKNR